MSMVFSILSGRNSVKYTYSISSETEVSMSFESFVFAETSHTVLCCLQQRTPADSLSFCEGRGRENIGLINKFPDVVALCFAYE